MIKKLLITLLTALAIGGCGIIKPIPIETNTQVHIKDSTAVHWIDSIRIHEATRYRDFSWIGDTLQLKGNRSRAWAVADTLKGCLIGEIEEDKTEEHSKIIYKDRIQYRDSIQVKKEYYPLEVPVEKKIYPLWMIVLSCLGVASTLVLGFSIYLRIKKRRIV